MLEDLYWVLNHTSRPENKTFQCEYQRTLLQKHIWTYSCLKQLFRASIILSTENPWPQHMGEITGLGVVDLLDCTLHLHQQW